MRATTHVYHPPTVEPAPDEDTCLRSTTPHKHISPGRNVVYKTAKPLVRPISDRLLTLTPANKRRKDSSVVEPLRIPAKCILKRVGSPVTDATVKRVRFGEIPAVNITTGEIIQSSPTSGKEYRKRERSPDYLDARVQRRMARHWNKTTRRIVEQASVEAEARRIGGQKRVEWRRGLVSYLRKNGLNGKIDQMGRFAKDRDQDDRGHSAPPARYHLVTKQPASGSKTP